MFETLVLLANLSGCAAEPSRTDHFPDGDAVPSVPSPEQGTLTINLEARGQVTTSAVPRLQVLSADEGEACVTGWITTFLAPSTRSPGLVVPSDPVPGMVLAIPPELPVPDDFETHFWPPVFYVGDQHFAWFGGTWSFVTWTSERVEVALAGGVTCETDEADGLWPLPETCVADSGTLSFEAPSAGLELTDLGYRGKSYAYTDPTTGEPLCHDVTFVPEVEMPTGE